LRISENTVEQHLMKAARRVAQVLFEAPQSIHQETATDEFRLKRNSLVRGGLECAARLRC